MSNYLISGVSRGLGKALVRTMLEGGDCVWGIGRSGERSVEDLIVDYPQTFKYLSFDLSNLGDIKTRIFGELITKDIPLDGLVNNAAIAYADLVTNMNTKQLLEMFEINVYAAFLLTKYTIRNMILHGRRGSIVNISSVCARKGFKGLAMYAATKGALESFSASTAREWGSRGIRSNCVAAGFMQTDMSASLTEESLQKIFNRSALKSPTKKESVAQTVRFLLGSGSESITGQVVGVDSGA